MKKVNEINIKINKAILSKISVELDFNTNEPKWVFTGSLISETGKKVSEFTYYSKNASWNESMSIDYPLGLNGLGREMFEQMSPYIVKKIQGEFKELAEKSSTKAEEGEVINPDDLPF